MITKHITEVTTKFNPFKKPAKTCRVFLAHLPANARQSMKINTKVLARDSAEPSSLKLKFSTSAGLRNYLGREVLTISTEDGKEMSLDTEKMGINDVVEEVDRHSRMLNRKADLGGN